MIEIMVKDFKLPSLNTLLGKWNYIRWRNNLKKDYAWLLLPHFKSVAGEILQLLGKRPLKLSIEVSFKGKRMYDADNVITYAKFFMDAFKQFVGIDDTHQLISEVKLTINPEVKEDIVIYRLCPKNNG